MTIPSSATLGWSKVCPKCGAEVATDPWAMFGDATCSECRSLLWYLHLEPKLRIFDHESSRPIREQVIAFVASRLGVPPEDVSGSSFAFDDLGTDSLETIEFVTKLERAIDGN